VSALDSCIAAIRPVDRSLEPAVRAHLDELTKPPGSLGRLEDLAAEYCLMRGTTEPRIARKRVVTFAGDHGVVAQGVSAFPSAVTPQMVRNMLAGGAAVSVLARHVGAEAVVVDVGVDDPLEGAKGLRREKVRRGTADIAVGPAMTREEALRALEVGITLADEAAADGVDLLATGEMGIGNTTPAAALLAALLPADPAEVTGRGTGIDDERLCHKIEIVRRALRANVEALGEPIGALAALGGLEIAAMAGLMLGAARHRIPLIVDGCSAAAAAGVAAGVRPAARDYLLLGHRSEERGHSVFVERFGLSPILDLRMRLGEGTGAVLAMGVVEAAVRIYSEMATFASAGVSGAEA